MELYTYHSPEGDRTLKALKKNSDGTVDLGSEDGALEIAKCTVGTREGACEPQEQEKPKSEKK